MEIEDPNKERLIQSQAKLIHMMKDQVCACIGISSPYCVLKHYVVSGKQLFDAKSERRA